MIKEDFMIQTDCHLHTSFSSDSSTPMKDMIEKAVELNLKTLCFTEHMDYEFPSHYNLPFTFNVNSFIQKFLEYKCHYKNKIELLMGIELGLKPTYKIKDYTSLTTDYPWDFIIGSTHLVGDIDPYYPEYWNNKSEIDQLQRYYKEIISNLHAFHTFDSLGHLDLSNDNGCRNSKKHGYYSKRGVPW